jgi:uncharacterized protein
MLIGVISDTHGLLRPAALDALRGAKQIIHAGDVGAPEILDQFAAIAPVTAVRGNVDKGAWALKLPETEVIEAAGISIYSSARSRAARSEAQSRRVRRCRLRPQPRP